MSLSILLLNSVVLFALADFNAVTEATKCERIDSSLLPNCTKIGYNFTANFSLVGLQKYQAYVSSEVAFLSDRFSNCSRHSRALVCARYVPKCSENVEGPVLPCREVCEQFVDDCENALSDSGHYYQYVAFCRLLSSERDRSTQCLKPAGFVARANVTKERRLPSCEAESKAACLKNKLYSLENRTRTRLKTSLNRLAPVLNSNCSLNLKRLACLVETAPCSSFNGRTLHACPSLCQEVKSSCEDEFKRHNIPFPRCIPNHAESSAGYGLCDMPQLPIPWPISGSSSGQKLLQCFCSNCANERCTTNGSCFVGRSSKKFIQSCIDNGKQRDSICNSVAGISANKQDAYCCEKDFCNGKSPVPPTVTSPSTAKPTETTVEPRDKGESNMKNAPDTTESTKDSEKKGIASGFLALAVVGLLLVIFVAVSFGTCLVKKIRRNSEARKPGSPNYVKKSNISCNGKAVTIGHSNNGLEEGNVEKTDPAFHY